MYLVTPSYSRIPRELSIPPESCQPTISSANLVSRIPYVDAFLPAFRCAWRTSQCKVFLASFATTGTPRGKKEDLVLCTELCDRAQMSCRYSSNTTKVPDFAMVDHVTRVTIILVEMLWGIFKILRNANSLYGKHKCLLFRSSVVTRLPRICCARATASSSP